ncbi:MAG: G8 domain-containing protein [bacterium]
MFDQTRDHLLEAHYIWVKGKIKIGTPSTPYKYNATIVLHG